MISLSTTTSLSTSTQISTSTTTTSTFSSSTTTTIATPTVTTYATTSGFVTQCPISVLLQVAYDRAAVAGAAAVTVTFNVQVTGASGQVSYYWAFGNGATATEGPSQTYTYQIPSNYTVAARVIDANGCSDQANAIVNVMGLIPEFVVNASPVVAVSFVLIFIMINRMKRKTGMLQSALHSMCLL